MDIGLFLFSGLSLVASVTINYLVIKSTIDATSDLTYVTTRYDCPQLQTALVDDQIPFKFKFMSFIEPCMLPNLYTSKLSASEDVYKTFFHIVNLVNKESNVEH